MANSNSITLAKGLRICAINLKRHTDRREKLLNRAAQVGLDISIFEGFDASERPEEELVKLMPTSGFAGPLSPKNRGCTASHLLVLQEFVASNDHTMLVIEDDVAPTPELVDWVTDLSWWPEGAGIVRFEAWGDPRKFHVVGRDAHNVFGRDLVRLWSMHPGTGAYMITKDAARTALEEARTINVPIDHFLFNPAVSRFARTAEIWQMRPALMTQVEPVVMDAIRKGPKAKLRKRSVMDNLRRGYMDLGGIPRRLGKVLTGNARLVRPE